MGEIDALRQAYSEGRYADAWAEYRRLTAMGPVSAEAHLVGARAADRAGDLYAARRVVDLAMEAEPAGTIRAEVLFTRGVILLLIGELAGALDDLQAAVAALEDEPNLGPVMLGPTHYNLGLALRQRRRYSEAAEHYRLAIDRFRTEGMDDYRRMALQNLAWVCCLQGDIGGAREALDEACPLCLADRAKLLQQIHGAFLGSMLGGDHAREAVVTCEHIMGDYGDIPPDIRSHACWVAGRIAMQLGQLAPAEALANSAVSFALQARGDCHSLLDASDLLREVKRAQVKA